MIKNIFIPEKIGTSYLFSKTIVGLDIAKTHIDFCVIQLKGTTTTILNQFEEKIDLKTEDVIKRTQEALIRGMARIKSYDEIRTSLSSAGVIYKYLTIPFTSYEKINLILPFEIESTLPFALSDALIDFVILDQNKEQGSTTILVAAVQKQTMEKHLDLFNGTPYTPTVVGVDMINMYYLFKLVDQNANANKNVVLLDFGLQTTTVGLVVQSKLQFIRTIQQGISHIAKNIGDNLNIPPHQAMENIIRFGAQKETAPALHQATQDALSKFWSTIKFTIQSFVSQAKQENVDTVFVFGDGATVKNTIEQGTQELGLACQWLSINALATNKNIAIKYKDLIPNSGLMSVATAFVFPETELFNLRKGPFELVAMGNFIKSMIVTLALTLLIVIGLLVNVIWNNSRLNSEKEDSQKEVITALKKQFPSIAKEADEEAETTSDIFDDTIQKAQQELKNELETLSKFSHKSRGSFIHYLFELTQRIDKRALGFRVDRIVMNDKEISMTAHVRDADAIQLLERELSKSELFTIERVQHPDFTMRIMVNRSLKDVI
jgi:type IV pilus assembly protein PilM